MCLANLRLLAHFSLRRLQTQAAELPGDGPIGLGERIENVRQGLRCDAHSAVVHFRDDGIAFDVTSDAHAAVMGREFDGVPKEVPEDLLKPGDVSLDDYDLVVMMNVVRFPIRLLSDSFRPSNDNDEMSRGL